LQQIACNSPHIGQVNYLAAAFAPKSLSRRGSLFMVLLNRKEMGMESFRRKIFEIVDRTGISPFLFTAHSCMAPFIPNHIYMRLRLALHTDMFASKSKRVMEQKKIILITGTDNAHCTSVAYWLISQGKYRVRCLTDNPYSAQATTLQIAGVEIVTASMDDVASLSRAMQGVFGVFGATDAGIKEYQQGKNLVAAVAANRIDYFIYSSLPAVNRNSSAYLNIPFADNKAAIQEYARNLKPDSSFIHVADSYDNFLLDFLPQRSEFGTYAFELPMGDANYAMAATEDIGPVVGTMFDHPEVYRKRVVGIVGSDMPCAAYASILSRVLGKNFRYRHIDEADYASLGFDAATENANWFTYQRLHIPNRQIDLIESFGLHPAMQGFEKWLIKNKDLFLQAINLQQRLAV
jgi:uncharacterized protein YbjT (DUF2867 family)